MKVKETLLLSHTAKLAGARFRRVISEEMKLPRAAADFAESLEEGRNVEIYLPESSRWTPVTSPQHLRKLMETAWTTGYQLSQGLLPPVAGGTLLLSDAGGRIQDILLQCPSAGLAEKLAPVWDQLARHTSDQTTLSIAVPAGPSGDEIRKLLTESIEAKQKLRFLAVAEGQYLLSQWSRDSTLALQTPEGGQVLGVPNRRHWSTANNNPEGVTMDTAVAYLMARTGQSEAARPLPWISLDGGNVVSNHRTAFVGADSLRDTENLLKEYGSEQPSVSTLQAVLGKEVVVLPQMTFHIDLACTPVGEEVVLVADPAWGRKLLEAVPVDQRASLGQSMARAAGLEGEELLGRYLENPVPATAFDETAEQLKDLGYQVIRVPYLPAPQRDQPILSYNNVLIEEYADVKQVFLPQYGCPPLDQAARKIYEELGYTVVPVEMAEISRKQGALRCSALPTEREFSSGPDRTVVA